MWSKPEQTKLIDKKNEKTNSKKETSDLDKRKKYEKSHKLAGKSVSRKKKRKGSVLVVLAQNLFYN